MLTRLISYAFREWMEKEDCPVRFAFTFSFGIFFVFNDFLVKIVVNTFFIGYLLKGVRLAHHNPKTLIAILADNCLEVEPERVKLGNKIQSPLYNVSGIIGYMTNHRVDEVRKEPQFRDAHQSYEN
ncbi:hypothetical protein GQX74_010752 [Glossina fuscipes]|nr:hypothetical protein GQX74_010752 [Glossina fuscipes]